MAGVFRIRKARLEDAGEILACLAGAFAPYRVSYSPAGFADTVLTERALRQRFREMTVLVAVDQSGEVIGTIAYKVAERGHGHVRGMAAVSYTHLTYSPDSRYAISRVLPGQVRTLRSTDRLGQRCG